MVKFVTLYSFLVRKRITDNEMCLTINNWKQGLNYTNKGFSSRILSYTINHYFNNNLHGIYMKCSDIFHETTLEIYKNGNNFGVSTIIDHDGNLKEYCIYISNNKRITYLFYKNGNLNHYFSNINDNIHGTCYKWYETGQLWKKCNIVKYKLHGLYKEWDINGNIIKKSLFYEDDKIEIFID